MIGSVAVINVGTTTETEMKEKKARVEDAINASRAAVEEGVVPGRRCYSCTCIVKAIGSVEVTPEQKLGVVEL